MSKMQNHFIWYDLMTPDVEGAKKFYGDVIGWTFTAQTHEYTVANVGKTGIGGIMATPENLKGMPSFWSGYINTPDVDAACAKIKKLGGKVHREPWDVPGILRMAIVGDPTGANFNIMKPHSTEQPEKLKDGTVGTIGWNEAHVGDLDKAWAFYSEMFGWTKGATMPMGDAGDYQLFQIDSKDVGGMMKKMDATPMPMWAYYFNVNGIDAAVARIIKAGGKIANGPMEVPGPMWTVSARDPQGAFFHLVSATK